MLKDFREFIMRGNVLDLAIAVIIGTAFNQVVNSMVTDVITPIIGLFGGTPDFSSVRLGPVNIGKFINAAVSFLVVSIVIFLLIVKPLKHFKRD